jgi:hypothetical protein
MKSPSELESSYLFKNVFLIPKVVSNGFKIEIIIADVNVESDFIKVFVVDYTTNGTRLFFFEYL